MTEGGGTVNLGSGQVTSGQNTTGALASNTGQASVFWTLGYSGAQTLKATTPEASGHGVMEVLFSASVGPPSCLAPGITHATPISSSETWRAGVGPHHARSGLVVTGGAVLTIDPGVVVCVDPGMFLDFTAGARLQAVGTATAPIRIAESDLGHRWNGIRLVGGSGVGSHLDYVTIERSEAGLTAGQADPVIISHSTIQGSGYFALGLSAPGSQFLLSEVDGTERVEGVVPRAAVEITQSSIATGLIQFHGRVIRAAGVGIKLGTGNVDQEASCEVSKSEGNGIEISSQAAGRAHVITGCNIYGNRGFGVVNPLVGFRVDARSNWWGDSRGPLATFGDGVSGDVDAGAHLAQEVALSYAPAFSGALATGPAERRIPPRRLDNQKPGVVEHFR